MTRDPLPEIAYRLPDYIDQELQVLHAVILTRLREDVEAFLANSVVHELMIERVAFIYIQVRHKERNKLFGQERYEKEYQAFLVALLKDFHSMAKAIGDTAAVRTQILHQVSEAIIAAVDQCSLGEPERRDVYAKLSGALEHVGL